MNQLHQWIKPAVLLLVLIIVGLALLLPSGANRLASGKDAMNTTNFLVVQVGDFHAKIEWPADD